MNKIHTGGESRLQTRIASATMTGRSKEEDRGMGEAENRQTVERVFQALTEGQVELFHAQFHENSVIEFPQTGEAHRRRREPPGCVPDLSRAAER